MEISEVFRDELKEEFSRLELILLNLEKEPSAALKDQAKRILHNMKGSSRVAGFEACGRVIHYLETLLVENPLPQVLETLLCGMDLSLGLVEPNANPDEADRFIQRPLPLSLQRRETDCASKTADGVLRETAIAAPPCRKRLSSYRKICVSWSQAIAHICVPIKLFCRITVSPFSGGTRPRTSPSFCRRTS